MFSIKTGILTALIITASLVSSAWGQQPAPAAQPRMTEYVEEKGFKGRVFDVKNREPRLLYHAVAGLLSGFKGASISYSDEFKTLTVRDFPENIATIEEALKRLDTPQSGAADIELRMHVLLASNTAGGDSPIPADLSDVVKQLQATLTYKNYNLITSVVQRLKSGAMHVSGSGVGQVGTPLLKEAVDAPYEYGMETISVTSVPSGAPIVQIKHFRFLFNPANHRIVSDLLGRAQMASDLAIREGEKVVVGTASLKDKAMIVVLAPRIVK